MSTWLERATPGTASARITYKDGLVACQTVDGKWVVTSPNSERMPLPVIGPVSVVYRADGRFGVEDPIQWPQIFCDRFPHFAAILRRPDDPSDFRLPIWKTVDAADFVPLKGSVVSTLGTLSSVRRKELQALVNTVSDRVAAHCLLRNTSGSRLNFCDVAMRNSSMRLDYPSTFRDIVLQVVNVQRYWLECVAWLDWMDELWNDFFPLAHASPPAVRNKYMGAFTTDPAVAQKLLSGGIPVWLMRHPDMITADVVIRKAVFKFETPDELILDHGLFSSSPVYSGMAGARHLAATSLGGHTYQDFDKTPVPDLDHPSVAVQPHREPASGVTAGGSVIRKPPSRVRPTPYPPKKAPVARGRDKFRDVEHSWMPRAIEVWKNALAAVDRTSCPATTWGYCVPEPAVLVTPKSIEKQQHYISNWLRVRESWLYMLGRRPRDVDLVAPQWWRDFLNSDPTSRGLPQKDTKTGVRKMQVHDLFLRVFAQQDLVFTDDVPLEWFGSRVATLSSPICRQILWELFEVGFRFELLELDRHLCPTSAQGAEADAGEIVREDLISRVFPDDNSLRVKTLPSSHVGLAALRIQDRLASLEALRKVMCRWPNIPTAIRAASFLHGHRSEESMEFMEKEMVEYYVQTFYDHSGRAALVPHLFPLA